MKLREELQRDWPMATEIRKLESRLWQRVVKQELRVVLFTSALRGEGKSTTVAYLAAALAAHPARRILAVDLDFRRPSLGSYFEVEPQAGLADVLRDEKRLEEAITPSELPGLHLILATRSNESADPNLLLDTVRLHRLITGLRESYDLILLDTPALIPVSDAASLIPLSDAVVLVAMAGVTTKHHLSRARELCLAMEANILGLVVGNIQEAAPEYMDADYYNAYAPGRKNGKET
jgi:non-specific protein-tyrosine kinase